MTPNSITKSAFRMYNRLSPIGRPLTIACLGVGYLAVVLGVFAPNMLNSVDGFVPDSIMIRAAYLVTFAYPAAYVVLALVASYGAVNERSTNSEWTRRDYVGAYLSIAFGEWTLHHLLYVQFPLALVWGYLSLPMGTIYAVPVWGVLVIAIVGVLVGNRYLWYHD